MHDDFPSVPGFEDVSPEGSYVLDITVHPVVLILMLDLLLCSCLGILSTGPVAGLTCRFPTGHGRFPILM